MLSVTFSVVILALALGHNATETQGIQAVLIIELGRAYVFLHPKCIWQEKGWPQLP